MSEAFNQLAPSRIGPMLVNRHDRFVGRSVLSYGEFSPGEGRFFRSVLGPGMVAFDVGANIGYHTVAMARIVGPSGKVLAFEPQRMVFQTLNANVAMNCLTNVWTYWSAVGSHTGHIAVSVLDPDAENNFGGLELGDQGILKETVPLVTLDLFAHFTRVDLLKVDVEGMEGDVLDGARKLIAKHKPMLYVENDRPQHDEALRGLIGELGYEAWKHDPPLFEPKNYAGNGENVWGRDIQSHNLICVHESRVGEYVAPE